MNDYTPVEQALESGAEPAMLCATCPWDRNCINPPQMTRGDVQRQIEEATAKDRMASMADPSQMPTGSILTALVMGGKDEALYACPVLVLRFRTADGRRIADSMKAAMQSWDDQ